jgi:hypothetical protein
VYGVRVVLASGQVTYGIFVVRADNPEGTLLYHTSEFTWQAYNGWDGMSLYQSKIKSLTHAVEVSTHRPFASGNGLGQFLFVELPLVEFIEENGFFVDYCSDLDIAQNPSILQQYTGVITAGHDEYWTASMRDAFDQARASGINLGFFGANIGYWQVRIQTNTTPNWGEATTIIGYKSYFRQDPDYLLQPNETTGEFQLPPVNRPPAQLLGLEWGGAAVTEGGASRVYFNLSFSNEAARVFVSGPQPGTVVPGIVGYEWDTRPAVEPVSGIIEIGNSSPVAVSGKVERQDTIVFRAPSGAFVFAAGTIGWSYGLEPPSPGAPPLPESAALRAFTYDIFKLLEGDSSVLAKGGPL